ncbi:MAG: TonB-dependent receptor [Mangrovibacterium sp.]
MKKFKNKWFAGEYSRHLKLLRIMKLTLILTLTGLMTYASSSFSQNSKLSINLVQATMMDIFNEIEAQTDYKIAYNSNNLDASAKTDLRVNNKTVKEVLDMILEPSRLKYELVGRYIVITDRADGSVLVDSGQQQISRLTGKVTSQDGQPIPGATVLVKGTSMGTITDSDGNFVLNDVPSDATLVFSFVGMRTSEVFVEGRSVVNVRLEEETIGIEEVVAIGYGTIKKRDLTGAVQSVKSDEIVMAPTGNVMEALQGKVAGLNISRSSGRAGAEVNMTLRGMRSINGSNTPLFIIDGVEGNYSDINPNDVESIEVLKDASSTAIYGSAGANGVIIITTKTGKKGKVNINFDAYYGINGMLQFPSVRMGDDYIELRRQANLTTGAWSAGDPDSKIFSNDEWNAIQNNQWVDWFDLGTRNGALQNYSFSMSGGNEKTSGYFSVNYYNEEGILTNDDNTRYSFRANVEHKVNDWLKGGLNVLGAFTDRNERKGQYFTRVLSLMPLGTPFNEDGSVNPFPLAGDTQLSPIADMAENQYTNNYHILGVNPTAFIEITPVKGLSVKSVLSSYLNYSRQGLYKGALSADGYGEGKSSAQVVNDNKYNYKWENIINYSFDINGEHNFVLTGVTSWAKNQQESSSILGYDLSWDKYLFHNLGATDLQSRVASSSFIRTQMMSYVARVNYNYKGRYLFSLSNRWDGASILAEGNKWDSFPAASVAWRISDESFMANAVNVDNLKLRVGYGVTGNAGAEAYATLNFGVAGSNLAFQDTPAPYYMFSRNIANTNLGWEKSYNWNVGVDLNMYRNRLNVTLDAYQTDTKDILFQRNLPASTGGYRTSNYTIWENVCETQNRGVEAVINSVNVRNNDFVWSSTLTFAANHEEITEFTSDDPVTNGDYYLVEGEPINSYYDYKYLGIWQENEATEAAKYNRVPGDVKILDVYDDDQYTTADRVVLGSPTPNWTAGFSNTFEYKGFDLTLFLEARWGQLMEYGILGWYNPDGTGNGPAICDYWTPENPGGRFPRPNASYGRFANLPLGSTSLMYIDGSYVKLKNITLGYSLPKSILSKLDLSKARFYVTAANPFIYTKSKYLEDYDPERGGADEFPLARQIVFGVNLSF